MNSISLLLEEWGEYGPHNCSELKDINFEQFIETANKLSNRGCIEIKELKDGITIKTKSYVGRIQIGPFIITIKPKIDGMPLLNILRYSYGLRQLIPFEKDSIDFDTVDSIRQTEKNAAILTGV